MKNLSESKDGIADLSISKEIIVCSKAYIMKIRALLVVATTARDNESKDSAIRGITREVGIFGNWVESVEKKLWNKK